MDRGLSCAPSAPAGCCHLRNGFVRSRSFRLEVDIEFGIAFDFGSEGLKFFGMGVANPAWLSPGCCSGSISPPSDQSSSTEGGPVNHKLEKDKGKRQELLRTS